jgi:hypothetical protein
LVGKAQRIIEPQKRIQLLSKNLQVGLRFFQSETERYKWGREERHN